MKYTNIKLAVLLAFIFLFIKLNAQTNQESDPSITPIWTDMMQDPNANFFSTQQAFETYWHGRTQTKGDGWKVFKRWESYMQTRVSQDGTKPAPDYLMQQYAQMNNAGYFLSTSGSWTAVGPTAMPSNGTGQPNGLGRVNDVAFHPSDANTIYVGAPSGGVWKTINGGTTWNPLTDNLPSLGVSSVLVDPNNANIVYLGTGDRDAGDAPGIGVYKSINGGSTWAVSNSGMGNVTVNKIIINASNSSVLLAATSAGIYKSTNAGATWQLKSSNAKFKDLVIKPSNFSIIYATVASSSGATFWRTMNGGDTWSQISTGLTATGTRMVIGVSNAGPDIVYLLAGGSSGLVACYKSTNGGSSFASQSTTPNILGYSEYGTDNSSQAYYDLAIAVDPTNANTIYVGGINIWKSTNGGASWAINAHWVGSGGVDDIHADQHCLVYSPSNVLFNGNDGGVYKTSNGGTTWTEISSGLAISQIYKIGQSATNTNLLIAGFQDNGTAVYNSTWTTEIGGDGMECIIDPLNTQFLYGSLYYGDIRRSIDGGSSFSQIADNGINGINESGGWVTPFCLREGQSSTMFVGYKNVWRSTNVQTANASSVTWTVISTFGNTSNLNVIENSPANSNVLYVSRGSSIFRSDNANAASPTWVTLGGLSSTVTDIEAHPSDANIVYATAGNNVYKSVNKGQSWSSISGNLPAVSMNTLVYDVTSSEGLYVGSDLGVFYKDANLANWISFSTGFPTAIEVTDLDIFYGSTAANHRLKAATYGRGVWTSDLYLNPSAPPIADFSVSNVTPCNGEVVAFDNTSSANSSSWTWTISPSTFTYVNASSATSQNPFVKFTATGVYTISLVATSTTGSDTMIKTNYITVGTPNSTPFVESFQTFTIGNPGTWTNGWSFSNTGIFNWQANSGDTYSAGTGPSVDHTLGTTAGIYLYTEASVPASQGEVTNLISPCISIPSSGNISLSFYYHMYGATIDGLHVDVYNNGNWVNDLYTITGQQQTSSTSTWQQASVSLNSYLGNTIKLRFRVTRGSDYTGDLAIDDIFVGTAGYPVTDFVTSQTATCVGGVNSFIDLTSNGPTNWQWSFSPNTVTYMSGTSSTSQNPKVMFTAVGNYTVSLISTNSIGTDTMIKNNYVSAIAANALPYTEAFETFGVGTPGTFQNGWSTANIGTFPWYANAGATPSNYTGPSVDHTMGTSSGKYLFTEASVYNGTGNEAILVSPCVNLMGISSAKVSFWYHMYGATITALRMDVYHLGNWISDVKVITGQQQTAEGDAWIQTTVDLSAYVGSSIKVRFRVVHPYDYQCDVAIDDVQFFETVLPVNDDPCGAIALSVSSTCVFTLGSNIDATTTTGILPPGCGGSISEDVWFKAIVPQSGSMIIDAEQITGYFADGAMAAYKGSCNTLILVGCNDDYGGGGNMPYLSLTNQTPGDTIFIRFWKYGGGTGNFNLCITEPPHFVLSPTSINVNYNLGSTSITVNASPGITWSVSDNASWLTVAPASGTASGSILLSYSANSGVQRSATITAIAAGFPNRIVSLTQAAYVDANFTVPNQMICTGTAVVFTNTSTNANSYYWYVNGVQQATTSNFGYTFSTSGIYAIKLKILGTYVNDSITKTIFVEGIQAANAGTDTALCQGGDVTFNPTVSTGIMGCTLSCNIPSYCVSMSNNDNDEYITSISLNGVSNTSNNEGAGYQDFTSGLLTPVLIDSTYTLSVGVHVNGTYTEYADAFIDWDRNGLFDEPAISLGSASITTTHVFNSFVTVPSTAILGKTKMRVMLKYANAITSPCENHYAYGETEDYWIEILKVDTLNHSWTGPSSFSSNAIDPIITNVTTAQGGSYTLSTSNAYGCSSNDVRLVTINPQPTVSLANINSVCINSAAFTLNQGSPSGGTYSGPGVSGGVFNPTTAGVGTHTIHYTYTNATACTDSASNTITVNALPSVSFTGLPAATCVSNANISLSGSPTGGTFTGNGIQSNQFSPSLAGVGNHTISYSYTNSNACSATAVHSVMVHALPIVNAGSDVTINYNTTTNLQSTVSGLVGSGIYQWSPASKVVNPSNAYTLTVPLTASTIFKLKVTDNGGGGCSDSDQVIVTITGGPLSLSVSADKDTICSNDTVNLQAMPGGGVGTLTYAWISNPAGFTSSTLTPSVNPLVDTWYIFTVSDASTSLSDSIFVKVNASTAVDFTLPSQVCVSTSSITLTPSAGVSGGVFSGNYVTGNVFSPSAAGVGSYAITYTYTNANACASSKTKNIVVLALPNVNMSSLSQVCSSTPAFTLTNGTPYGGTYSGSGVSGLMFNPTVAGLGTHIIYYHFTDQQGCANMDSTSILVNSSPIANAGFDLLINTGSSVSLSGSATGGSGLYSYAWTPANLLTNATIYNPSSISLTSSQLFQLTVTDQQTLCSDLDEMLVIVMGGSLSVLIQVGQSPICQGTSTTLNAIASGGTGNYTYQWNSSIGGFSSTLQNPVVSPSVTTAYVVYVSDGVDTVNTGQFVIVDPSPIGALSDDTTLCSNGQIVLDAGGGYANYQWSNGLSGQQLPISGASLPFGSTQYYVTITNANGCMATDSTNVDVVMAPVNLLGVDTTICEQAQLVLDAGAGMLSYLWSNGTTTQTFTVLGSFGIGSYPLWVEVVDANGCTGRDSIDVEVVWCSSVVELNQDFEVSIYPNPSNGIVTVEIKGNQADKVDFMLYDLQGKLVYETKIDINANNTLTRVDLGYLASGMYHLRLQGEQLLRVQKLIIR